MEQIFQNRCTLRRPKLARTFPKILVFPELFAHLRKCFRKDLLGNIFQFSLLAVAVKKIICKKLFVLWRATICPIVWFFSFSKQNVNPIFENNNPKSAFFPRAVASWFFTYQIWGKHSHFQHLVGLCLIWIHLADRHFRTFLCIFPVRILIIKNSCEFFLSPWPIDLGWWYFFMEGAHGLQARPSRGVSASMEESWSLKTLCRNNVWCRQNEMCAMISLCSAWTAVIPLGR